MVYRNYGRGRRQWGKRRRYKRTRGYLGGIGKAISIAGSALAVAKGVKSLMNVEFKNQTVDDQFVDYDILSTGTIVYLTPVAQGITEITRNGNSIRAKSMDLKGYVTYDSGGDDQQGVRLIMFIDYNYDGGNTPTVSGDAESVLDNSNIQSFRDLSNTDRFRVIYDKTFFVDGEHQTRQVKIHKELNHKVEYVGTNSSAASGGGGSIWMLLIGTQLVANYPTLNADYRFRYIDN